ncbi:YccT family protein [Vibrio hippocampi]|nr:DUF2057 domain-containing protein [Vibrio hippocampi]
MTIDGVSLCNPIALKAARLGKWIGVAAVSVAAFCVQATTVTPLRGVDLLFVNGVETESSSDDHQVAQGPVQLVVRMNKKVGRGSNERPYVSSPYIMTLQASGEEIKINHPVARSRIEAEAVFRKDEPEWRVLQDGNTVQYTVTKLEGNSGLFPYSDMEGLLEEYNKEHAPQWATSVSSANTDSLATAAVVPVATASAVATSTTASNHALEVSTVSTVSTPSDSENIDQLKAWYLKSSVEERKAFRRWMIDQE